MANNDNCSAVAFEFFNFLRTFALKCLVTNAENLVNKKNFWVNVCSDGKPKSHNHAVGVVANG